MPITRGFCWNFDGSDTMANNAFVAGLDLRIVGVLISGTIVAAGVVRLDLTLAPTNENALQRPSNSVITRVWLGNDSTVNQPFITPVLPIVFPIDVGESLFIAGSADVFGSVTVFCEVPN